MAGLWFIAGAVTGAGVLIGLTWLAQWYDNRANRLTESGIIGTWQ
jgi:hypothetical protein